MEIFVGCSSSEYIDDKYKKVAYDLGKEIALHGHSLIFGSSKYGLMGAVYRGVKENGGEVTAIMPLEYKGVLTDVEFDNLINPNTASDQLKVLVNTGDVTVIMPGSFGTLAELVTSIHLKKLGEHHKKIFILNAYGFFDDILNLFDKIYKDNFDCYDRNLLFRVVDNIDEIFKDLEEKKK